MSMCLTSGLYRYFILYIIHGDFPLWLVIHFEPGESHSEDAIMMNTPVVKAALEMGFSRRLIKQTVQSKILATGENYKTVNDLVSDLLTAEDEKREEEKERQFEEVASGMHKAWIKVKAEVVCIVYSFYNWFYSLSDLV